MSIGYRLDYNNLVEEAKGTEGLTALSPEEGGG